jgi:hypothetical protein
MRLAAGWLPDAGESAGIIVISGIYPVSGIMAAIIGGVIAVILGIVFDALSRRLTSCESRADPWGPLVGGSSHTGP